MQDPIGSFLRIRELYLSYLDTAFRIGDESVAVERRRLLREPGTLCTEPLVEPLPRYEPYELEFHELVEPGDPESDPLGGFDTKARRAFVELVLSGLIPSTPRDGRENVPTTRVGAYQPYTHQVRMLQRGTRSGTPGIVTSGTGSGKTESFLLPLFAELSREARGWSPPAGDYLGSRWWHDPATGRPYRKVKPSTGELEVSFGGIPSDRRPTKRYPRRNPFNPHRAGETRAAAVRALVLYPMNALVEDQMVRLRKALDSREAREVMGRKFHRNRIFFGRYTGSTPVTGYEDHPGFGELLDRHPDDLGLDDTVAFPDSEGRVTLGAIRDTEFRRRLRRQKQLFGRMVEYEGGQRSARYHAWRAANPEADDAEVDLSEAPSAFGDDAPFMFPSVDGAELVSRWDMQSTPPDILVTNVSMLGAMLTREVDNPIFEKTRAWLEEPDSYFYLILDELHLQRGSAGTEVSYLLRILFERLGLDREEHRHKLRILASSASLPADPEEEARKSAEYLWDMFGRFGLPAHVSSEAEGRELWRDSIVPGQEVTTDDVDPGNLALHSRPYVDLLDYAEASQPGRDGALAEALSAVDPSDDPEAQHLWRNVASDLDIGDGSLSLSNMVRRSIERVAAYIVAACWKEEEERTRATTIGLLAWSLFEDLREEYAATERIPYERALRAVRALLYVRGCGDGLNDFLDGRVAAPSFRIHTFFRSIEGLYAPAWKNAGVLTQGDAPDRDVEVGCLDIERETRREYEIPGYGTRSLRQFELLYCECCGELFFGGMRSTPTRPSGFLVELLPYEPQLDGLPEAAASQRFEELSFDQYAIFWPTERDGADPGPDSNANPGTWRRAALEPETGVVRARESGLFASRGTETGVPGFLYERRNRAGRQQDRHGRNSGSAESHVPYACPACGTDYFSRRRGMGRLSPLRNFRAGFAKTTQLLGTELFDAQRVTSPTDDTKLVSFADSRQDAAKAALDIERNHHQDLRRELLVTNLHRFASSHRREPSVIEAELDESWSAVQEAQAARDREALSRANEHVEALENELRESRETSIAITSVVENLEAWNIAGTNMETSWLIADMVRRGVHPYDDAGVARPAGQSDDGRRRTFAWDRLFEVRDDGNVFWHDEPRAGAALHGARRNLVYSFYQKMSDVIFSKTYFSLEESGLGYVTVSPGSLPETRQDPERLALLSALIRVIADAYRFWPSRYLSDDEPHTPWDNYDAVRTAKVGAFAEAVWGDSAETGLMEALQDLERAGHAGGIVYLWNLRIALTDASNPYWRCHACSRVHLHRGAHVCTRCLAPLPESAAGRVEDLQTESFLARRVLRALTHAEGDGGVDPVFRLHCEELTGQTEDPALRQRHFRGIFVPEIEERWENGEDESGENEGDENSVDDVGRDDSAPPAVVETSLPGRNGSRFRAVSTAFEAKETIDLLAVTTTMEVGIDIGPLRAVLQSNMPPQRFNYQQRVGRAGRRGQAFSVGLTICRTRSHDIHYFREPEVITGDVPPTPFLTKSMPDIAARFTRKRWLVEAFARLRNEDRTRTSGIYPGDLMTPPDIHGEFVPVRTYLDPMLGWRERLRQALEATRGTAERFAALLMMDGRLDAAPEVDSANLLEEVSGRLSADVAYGLAHALAEYGLLPMYGMPTRTRDLYLRFSNREDGPDASTIDRDLDVAIYEFAPGAKVVKDKYEHLCVGFTPDLGLPPYIRRNEETAAIAFQGDPLGERFRMVQCGRCSAWARFDDTSEDLSEVECGACRAIIPVSGGAICAVPNAFRTDFRPTPEKEESPSGIRHRSIQAEGRFLDFFDHQLDSGNGFRASSRIAFTPQQRTYRLNRGPLHDADARGFSVSTGTERVRLWPGYVALPDQAVSNRADLPRDFQSDGGSEVLWLAAPKTTDSLYLAPSGVYDGLALHRLPGPAEEPVPTQTRRWQGVRAAALSATFLLVNRAALELDIDPEELEVLEPRRYGPDLRLPLLQITDRLVNGAGFCRNLSAPDNPESDTPRILRIAHSMLSDPAAYPLERLLAPDHRGCDTACYRCLLRYGNQQYHGLLDWRLGLAYLRMVLDPDFACGLDRHFDFPGLDSWRDAAARIAGEMARRFDGETRSFADGEVPAFRLDLGRGRERPWVLVAHPLWDWHQDEELVTGTVLSRAEREASSDGPVACWDTFNLARRPVQVREWLRDGAW